MKWWERWKARARSLAQEVDVLYRALRHPRTPWYAKALAALVVAYALSPLDLIPDPIPVVGHLDDLLLIPLGVALVHRLIPAPVLAECRAAARDGARAGRAVRWAGAALVIVSWLAVLALIGRAVGG